MPTPKYLISIRFLCFLSVLLAVSVPLRADRAQADSLLQQGRADEAAALLREMVKSNSDNAKAHQLLCRIYYAQEMADDAIRECELAAAADPNDSDTQMWLGRAYGLKASKANPLTAFSLAKKVRNAFEHAVQLNPANVHAMSDLGEYYVAAPAIVGGGLDKAQRLAQQLQPYSAARYHRLLAEIANKKKDTATAEAEYRAAAATGKTPEAYIDLGQFYQEQGQSDKALSAVQAGVEADRRNDSVLVDAASILVAANRSPELAERLLREYLSSPAKSDGAPAFKVHVQLGDLLLKRGDSAGAHREYAAALALASNYVPARKAIQGT
ncbi:MAG TPA: tetratricopeptide repeat protein [Edaphobacter sp.]